jgi:hypothetical protein
MLGLIRDLNPEHKQPSLDRWANTIRLMRERDRRSSEDIRAVFAWANADSFWQGNILSPDKLRKQFDQLNLKRKQHGNPRGQANGSQAGQTRSVARVAAPAGKYDRFE